MLIHLSLGLRHDSLFIVFNFEYISLLQDEVMNLAEKYGRLQKCVVRTRKELHGDEAVRVFLEFETSQAQKQISAFLNPHKVHWNPLQLSIPA